MNGSDEIESPRAPNPLFTPLRLLLHWLIKLVVMVVLAVRAFFRPKAVRYGLPLLLVAGVVGWQLVGSALRGTNALPLSGSGYQGGPLAITAATNQLGPSFVVESYLQAEAAFDANTIWNLLGEDMKAGLEYGGIANAQQLQAQLDQVQEAGRRYLGAKYIGGMMLAEGEEVYFYVVKVGDASGTDSVEVPYIYVVGQDGKIVGIQ